MHFIQNNFIKNKLILEKESAYKDINQIKVISQSVGIDIIDVVFYDYNLPNDLKSKLSDNSIAFISWSPNSQKISNINWRIDSKNYINTLMKDIIFDDLKTEIDWMIRLENTQLNMYIKKYSKLFLYMAVKELLKNEKFVIWAKNKELKDILYNN